MAVVGAVLVAAWSGGAGIAQATDGDVDPDTCASLLSVASVDDQGGSDDPCDEIPVDVDCLSIPLPTEAGEDATVETDGDCSIDVTVDVVGNCEDPESFTFTVDATGLEAETDYRIYLTSADLTQLGPDEVPPNTFFDVTTDVDGSVKGATHTSTEGTFDFPAGEFTLTYLVISEDGLVPAYIDQVDISGDCTPEPQPGETTPTPAPTQPTPGAAAPTTPVVAPVVVTQPAVTQPAVLANTGTPVTAAALLGGGLLVAGAGALVATRRRSS
jgi:LPXTG-motif cell wall-anchored protein